MLYLHPTPSGVTRLSVRLRESINYAIYQKVGRLNNPHPCRRNIGGSYAPFSYKSSVTLNLGLSCGP